MPAHRFCVSGNVVDIPGRRVTPGNVWIEEGRIASIEPASTAENVFILPGFIDAHVHIESSMLVPSEFARLAVLHGTVATVSDPHEIANVLGILGVDFMIRNGSQVPFHFYFGAPSCVPATSFETAGAELGPEAVGELLQRPEIKYLAEMMNWPGVISGDSKVMAKLALAHKMGKPVDGHAPGLTGTTAEKYIKAGIHTDHECVSLDEAKHKLAQGMKIIIREGSAARNFDALIPLLPKHEDDIMFCSDDKHPDSLVAGHINDLARRAVAKGIDKFSVLKATCLNPIDHYGLDVGQLRVGDPADFIVVDDLTSFRVRQTYVRGRRVADNGKSLIDAVAIETPNRFNASAVRAADFVVPVHPGDLRVIVAHDGQLITSEATCPPKVVSGHAVADPSRDILKMTVINRYGGTNSPSIAFIKGFGLREGAIASSVAHDSHNIIAVGCDDESIASAINAIVVQRGGIATSNGETVTLLPLPVAGIMSSLDGLLVARIYQELDHEAKRMGSTLGAPFMTLSFMALLVIPSLKLSDKGLFDGNKFEFTPLFTGAE